MEFGSALIAEAEAPLPACNNRVQDQMETVRQMIEGRFRGAGEVLSEVVEGVGVLITALDKLTEALDPAATAATTEDLRVAAAKLSVLPAHQAERRSILEQLARHNGSFGDYISDMRRSLGYMRAFTMNIKITAGGIVGADSEFKDFVQDISNCLELGRKELDGLEADVGALHRGLKDALEQGGAVEDRCHTLIPAIPDALSASVAVVGEHTQKTAEAASQAASLARDIRKKVARTLAALQIGDITRQRIEHIQAGAAMLDESVAALSDPESARMRGLMYSLLASQLYATIDDFNQDVSDIAQGMSGLGADARELLRLRDLAYGRSNGAGDGFLKDLESRVQAALALVEEIDTADYATLQTGKATAAAAKALTARVAAIQQIKLDVQYMAFNTVLKSTRLGEAGRPLSVIAAELRTHSAHLETTAGHCLTVLDALNQSAAALTGDGAQSGEETETQAAARALTAAATRLHDAGDKTQGDLATFTHQGEDVLRLLDRSTSRLNLRQEIADPLDAVAGDLAILAQDTDDAGDVAQPLGALLAKLSPLYTMAKERQIHQGFAQMWGLDTAPPAPVAKPELEDVLF